jgi:hypothetical protein
MSYKSKFSDKEWQMLQYSILWVFHAIAELDGVVDEQEGKALLDAFKGKIYVSSELAREVVESMSGKPDKIIAAFKKDKHGIPMGLKDVAELVEKKLDAVTAKDFKLGLMLLGVAFANASNQVGTREAILTIAAILRLSLEDLKKVKYN